MVTGRKTVLVPREKKGDRPVGDLSIEDFGRIDLRVATVLTAERVPGTDKLIQLQVRIGEDERQLVAGIGQTYEPEDLPGRLIVVVANLKPAVIRGVESRGMLLAAVEGDRAIVISPEKEIPDGSRVQ